MTYRSPAARRVRPALAVAVLVALGVAGCGADEGERGARAGTATVAPIAPASLRPGEPVPAPKGRAVLTIRGAAKAKRVAFDVPTLERLGLTSIDLYEPFQKRRMRFRAVRLRSVIDAAGVAPRARELHSIALNDYTVDIPTGVARAPGVYLATHNGDGSPIKVEDGGPIRVVFLDGARGAANTDYWIWSLDAMDVR